MDFDIVEADNVTCTVLNVSTSLALCGETQTNLHKLPNEATG